MSARKIAVLIAFACLMMGVTLYGVLWLTDERRDEPDCAEFNPFDAEC